LKLPSFLASFVYLILIPVAHEEGKGLEEVVVIEMFLSFKNTVEENTVGDRSNT
jgi:hypothetical protein